MKACWWLNDEPKHVAIRINNKTFCCVWQNIASCSYTPKGVNHIKMKYGFSSTGLDLTWRESLRLILLGGLFVATEIMAWPSRSPDLSEAAGDFSWGYLKAVCMRLKHKIMKELKMRILGEIAAIYRVLRSVIKFFIEDVQKCIAMYYFIELIITN